MHLLPLHSQRQIWVTNSSGEAAPEGGGGGDGNGGGGNGGGGDGDGGGGEGGGEGENGMTPMVDSRCETDCNSSHGPQNIHQQQACNLLCLHMLH